MENTSIKILYVDDEKANLINFQFLFQDDYEVSTALSAKNGLELLKEEPFQIIISDQRMPDMTGVQFLALVSQLYPTTIRILLTAYTDTQDVIDAINIGQVYQYITKPFQEQMLKRVLEKASETWNLRRHNQELIIRLQEANEEYEQINEELRQTNEELLIAKEYAEESERNLKLKNEEYETINEELRQTNDELMIANEKIGESDRLKTAFLQNMSHEIRTPMNAIIGFSSLLDDPNLIPQKQKNYTNIIINSTHQLLSIVNDILTISSLETKQEKINIDVVSVNSVILDLLTIFKPQADNQKISLYAKQHLNNQESEIYTDATKLTQILTNLLANALKFTHVGSIEFGYTLNGSFLEFYVKDTGIGIDKDAQEKIFERFRQADTSISQKYGGTGLGLAISKAFVELLGGKIGVESEKNHGATFYFTLPYKPVVELFKSDSFLRTKTNACTVLVAEDEEYNFLYIEELLHRMDIKVIHAKDGNEAVEACQKHPEISLILMDIKMPTMNGYIAAQLIKEFRPHLTIVAQSAYALEHERERYGDVFDSYITKPINKDDFRQKIAKYLPNT